MGIKEGTNQQITPYMLEGIVVSRKQELQGKTSGCRRHRV
jgi:hypothetical protein